MTRVFALTRRLRRDQQGVALLEFAFMLPIFVTLGLVGAEMANFIITRMRVSQLALHLADNAARLGSGTLLSAKTVNEAEVNDLLVGTDLQSGELKIYENGRVIVTSVEPVATFSATSPRFRMRWSRCKGLASFAPKYKRAGMSNTTSEVGYGRDNKVTAPEDGATMFVEVHYQYKPLIDLAKLFPVWDDNLKIVETASMMVRDRRDLNGGNNGIYAVNGHTAATCT